MKTARNLLISLAVVLMSACLRDNGTECDIYGQQDVLIQLKMPDISGGTRSAAMTEYEAEYTIRNLVVLVFEDNGGSGDRFLYHTVPTREVTHPDNPTTRTYVLPVRRSENGKKQRLVFIANQREEVEAFLDSEIPDPESAVKTKEELFAELLFDHKVWVDGTNAVYGIPMWGESPASVVVGNNTSGSAFGKIPLLFGVAKIGFAVNADSGHTVARGLDGFSMTDFRIYNRRKTGFVVPQSSANYCNGVVSHPSIPSVGQGNQILPYANLSSAYPGNGELPVYYHGQFLVQEADNKNSTNDNCLFALVGGFYTAPGESTNTSVKTWYRVDFYDRSSDDPASARLDILRGHRYLINITGADGPGYPTPEEAAGSVLTKMDAAVVVWNELGIQTGMEGQYRLNVSEPEWSFDGNAQTTAGTGNRVAVFTDYSDGWKVSKIVDVADSGEEEGTGWLGLYPLSGAPYVTTSASVTVSSYGSAEPRRGRIYVTAGKWTYVINVEQKSL